MEVSRHCHLGPQRVLGATIRQLAACRITALIEAACNNAYDYTIAFEDADNVHYRMCAKQVKHLAPKQLKKNAKGTMPTPIERAT